MTSPLDKIIESIEKSLLNENWYSAIVLSLIIPDICAKVGGSKKSSKERYQEWFDKYLRVKYDGFLSGNDCYALRCSFLHEGSSSIEEQPAKEVLDHFVFLAKGAHCTKFVRTYFPEPKYSGKTVLQLSVDAFCKDIIEATKQWLVDPTADKNLSGMIEIFEGQVSIGRAVTIR